MPSPNVKLLIVMDSIYLHALTRVSHRMLWRKETDCLDWDNPRFLPLYEFMGMHVLKMARRSLGGVNENINLGYSQD